MSHKHRNYIHLGMALSAILLSGCAHQQVMPIQQSSSLVETPTAPSAAEQQALQSSALAQALAMQLAPTIPAEAKLGVTHFVRTDGQYGEANTVSQAFADHLMYQLAAQQVHVVDFKTTNYIRVTPDGDFALTRDYLELDEISPITHLLVGTYMVHELGWVLNARVVNIHSNQVVSVGQAFVPKTVIETIKQPREPLLRSKSRAEAAPQ